MSFVMKPAAPPVSVLMATHNRPAYLHGGPDDAGPSHNRTVVESFTDPRIRSRRNPERLGIAGNHSLAAREARGVYLAVLSDDDEWEPGLLTTLTLHLDANANVAVAFGDHHIIYAAGAIDAAVTASSSRRWKRDRLPDGEYANRHFQRIALIDQSVAIVAALFRSSAIGWSDFPLETGPAYDLWLTHLACRRGGTAWCTPWQLACLRVHPGSSRERDHARERKRCARGGLHLFAFRCGSGTDASSTPARCAPEICAPPLCGRLVQARRDQARGVHPWPPPFSKHGPWAALAMALSSAPEQLCATFMRRLRGMSRGAVSSSRKSEAVARWR
jgi:hypothetical protein